MVYEYKATSKKAIASFESDNEMTCYHHHIVFVEKDLAFCCESCTEEIVQVLSYDEFRLFCEFADKKESELLAGVFFYIRYYYVKLSKKLLKKK
jgi:hypothetical protein